MINDALKFIADEVNKYLISKIDPGQDATIAKWVVLDNVAKVQDTGSGGGSPNSLIDKAVLTLVNIEEDRVSKSQINFQKINDKVVYKNPKIYLNLYCLFAMNLSGYETALKWLSLIIQFFQYRNVFTHTNSPKLPARIDTLIFDLHTLNFEQINHLWGTLGGKYLPSELYKIRLVIIEDNTPQMIADAITTITINDKSIN